MRQLAIRIPFIDRIRRSRNRTVRIWRVLDDDRRVKGLDKGMQVGMRRVVVVANVGLKRAVCRQEAPQPSEGIDSGLYRGRLLTVQRGAPLHFATAKDGHDFGERFGVVVRVEEGEATREEAQENDTGRPDVEG